MELRSSRSRSKTPFVPVGSEGNYQTLDDFVEGETYLGSEGTVMRVTRSSTTKVKVTSSSNSNHASEVDKQSKSSKIVRKSRQKTSDYSSEDGEQQVSSTLISDQNVTNQLLEDCRRSQSRASNFSSHSSALDYYRAAGEYWNKYPKTDYTYSPYSKDRWEIEPGVIAMPNMSRRSLHSTNGSSEIYTVSHKQTGTDSYDSVDYTPGFTSLSSKLREKKIENNNYDSELFSSKLLSSTSASNRSTSIVSRTYEKLYIVISTVFTWIYTLMYLIFGQNSIVTTLSKLIYKSVAYIVLLDTRILKTWSTKQKHKTRNLIALCLIPLLIFAGWWLMSLLLSEKSNKLDSVAPIVSDLNFRNDETDKMVSRTERNTQDLPLASEIASLLSSQQLKEIAIFLQNTRDNSNNIDYEKLRLLLKEEPYKDNERELHQQSVLINTLREEVSKIREEMLLLQNSQRENLLYNAHLTSKLNRCCRTSFIKIESYVSKILKDLFRVPSHLSSWKDISNWLSTTFVAKQELESALANLTQHLQSDYNLLIENNGHILMNKIVNKLLEERSKKILEFDDKYVADINVQNNALSIEDIKKIVKNVLAVYDADKTGLVDYAMESAGGQVLSTRCTESYNARTAVLTVLGFPLWYVPNSPRIAINPGVTPGECWAFQNFPGFLVIKLNSPIVIDAFSLEHVNKLLVPTGKIDSAPKEFSIFGLRNESDNDPILLGKYVYDYDGPPLQYFASQNIGLVFDIIQLTIYSNHGNPNYTCVYRFRVHGRLDTESL